MTEQSQVCDCATIVYLLFLSCTSEASEDLLSGVCFFQPKHDHASAPLKFQLRAESKHCVVWRGIHFDEANVLGVGTYGSYAE